jgi:hormone-sensitive lipase
MIFMAGGGFVSLSSETAQSFTRKWANSLKIPIFSIDYRKAPKYRYPTAVEDCLTAYQFII